MAEQSKAKNFDVSKYQISPTTQKRKVVIEETGDEFEVSIKPLSWAKRNQLISKHLNWDSTGSTTFNGDVYVRYFLKEMVIDAPWVKTTETFLNSIDDRLGATLETLVPKAFGSEDTINVDKVKKES